jgi:hypothetical protein
MAIGVSEMSWRTGACQTNNGNNGTDDGNKGTDNGNKGTDNGNKGLRDELADGSVPAATEPIAGMRE